ncbi:extracellular solute-binding protein [Gloeocapsopsis sp. IPPAS B-1203]|uniref:extracellular solute-binding protein n=1 Tax=Gloeocapsopsis sp. IPPAS B-1203 TaxID=2049454 RepID=UPI000C19F125|nr:extracellular solute-binding protein [Gloeocapsopsis sp. IPPAS B-1203]PIG92525.1 ABC transporter substrate-binding protein [Gloeocapsopsis sp. IPPAS B-1203]
MLNRRMLVMSRRAMLGTSVFAGASLLLKACANSATTSNTPTTGGKLIATTLPGSWEQFNRTVLVPQFTADTNAEAALVPLVSADQVAKLQASPNNPPFDVLSLDSGVFEGVPKEKLFQKLPTQQLQNYSELAAQFQTQDAWGALIGVQAVGIAYNPRTVKTPPSSWQDLWSSQYKGRVALMAMRNNHTIGFMQKIAKIHGGSAENLEPAFDALEELTPNLTGVVANAGALITLFQQGEVDLAPHDLNSVKLLQSKGVDIDWVMPQEGGFALTPIMTIVQNPTASVELATAYIDAAISTDVQTQMTETNYVLPTNRNVPIPGAIAQKLGNNLEEILSKLEFLDWGTINKHRTAWIEQFDQTVQA